MESKEKSIQIGEQVFKIGDCIAWENKFSESGKKKGVITDIKDEEIFGRSQNGVGFHIREPKLRNIQKSNQ